MLGYSSLKDKGVLNASPVVLLFFFKMQITLWLTLWVISNWPSFNFTKDIYRDTICLGQVWLFENGIIGVGKRKVSCLVSCLQIYSPIKGTDIIIILETNGGQWKFGPGTGQYWSRVLIYWSSFVNDYIQILIITVKAHNWAPIWLSCKLLHLCPT